MTEGSDPEADADESGDDLKRRLAAHIGYLAIDMMVVRVEGEKLEGDKKLADQGVYKLIESTLKSASHLRPPVAVLQKLCPLVSWLTYDVRHDLICVLMVIC